jgi:hypothetical protein
LIPRGNYFEPSERYFELLGALFQKCRKLCKKYIYVDGSYRVLFPFMNSDMFDRPAAANSELPPPLRAQTSVCCFWNCSALDEVDCKHPRADGNYAPSASPNAAASMQGMKLHKCRSNRMAAKSCQDDQSKSFAEAAAMIRQSIANTIDQTCPYLSKSNYTRVSSELLENQISLTQASGFPRFV